MARGWESKSVESQQIEPPPPERLASHPHSREERERTQKRGSLELSRKRVLQDIEIAQSPVRRTSLEHALAFLDEEIKKLDG